MTPEKLRERAEEIRRGQTDEAVTSEMLEEAADTIEKILERHRQALLAVECSDKYAKDARPKDAILPTVWELQNGHIREALTGANN